MLDSPTVRKIEDFSAFGIFVHIPNKNKKTESQEASGEEEPNLVKKQIRIKEPTGKSNELNKKLFIFYNIKEQTEGISKIFWKMFSSSASAEKQLEEMKKIK